MMRRTGVPPSLPNVSYAISMPLACAVWMSVVS
jgi:hypothetical protein